MSGSAEDDLFGTKAETLNSLSTIATWFRIPSSFVFLASEWRADRDAIFEKILHYFHPTAALAVRSSAAEEDLASSSMAGRYTSYLNVPATFHELEHAIDKIISEYSSNPMNQVLVQEMVKNISCSGVTMTRDINDGAPYFVISYDDESGETDTVTGGKGVHKTVYIFTDTPLQSVQSLRVRQCLRLAKTLSQHYSNTPLDIEFAIGKDLSTHLLQVRRIANSNKWRKNVGDKVKKTLNRAHESLSDTFKPHSSLVGHTTVLANMSDWNPAEMIGKYPRPLAVSLYEVLITNNIWHKARTVLGYRKIRDTPLMQIVEGHPFIDVRASLNSFLPNTLEEQTATRLVNASLERLCARPELHDKVEFELAFTALDFDFRQEYAKRYPGVLTADELESYINHLRILTRNLLNTSETGNLYWSEQKFLELHSQQLKRYDLNPTPTINTVTIPVLLDECRTSGTYPFAMMARHAFVAEMLLRSAVQRNAMSPERASAFKRSIRTIATECDQLLRTIQNGEQNISVFTRLFGHLRPGSYDIRSARYTDRPGLLEFQADKPSQHVEIFQATDEERQNIALLFKESDLGGAAASCFFDYSRRAIAGREFGKFVFTRNLSDILEAIIRIGENSNLGRDALSYLRIEELCTLLSNGESCMDPVRLRDMATRGREEWESHAHIKLGYIIRSLKDLQIIPVHRAVANFVTDLVIIAPVAILDNHSSPVEDISNKIVCIENADPGFDWIFSCGIAGLITQYGGINSHMAVRCSEFAIPAAIGCGEQTFNNLTKAKIAELDCENNIVRPVDGAKKRISSNWRQHEGHQSR